MSFEVWGTKHFLNEIFIKVNDVWDTFEVFSTLGELSWNN